MDGGSPEPGCHRAPCSSSRHRLMVAGGTAPAASAPHANVDAVVSAVRERSGDGSAQTMYNGRCTFTGGGLVRQIEPAGWPGPCEVRVSGYHHHHRVCHRCADVACAAADTPCLTAADDLDHEIDKAEAVSWGQSPACVAATSVSSGEAPLTGGVRHELGDTALAPEQPGPTANRHQKAAPK